MQDFLRRSPVKFGMRIVGIFGENFGASFGAESSASFWAESSPQVLRQNLLLKFSDIIFRNSLRKFSEIIVQSFQGESFGTLPSLGCT